MSFKDYDKKTFIIDTARDFAARRISKRDFLRKTGMAGVGLSAFATGWLGLGHAFVGLLAAFMLGALVGVVAMVFTGAGRKTRIPFGPFLAAGAVLSVLWGSPVAHALFHHSA